jgi:hypothetical protein
MGDAGWGSASGAGAVYRQVCARIGKVETGGEIRKFATRAWIFFPERSGGTTLLGIVFASIALIGNLGFSPMAAFLGRSADPLE